MKLLLLLIVLLALSTEVAAGRKEKAAQRKEKRAAQSKSQCAPAPGASGGGVGASGPGSSSSSSAAAPAVPAQTVATCKRALNTVLQQELKKADGSSAISEQVKRALKMEYLSQDGVPFHRHEQDLEVIKKCHRGVDQLRQNIRDIRRPMLEVREKFIEWHDKEGKPRAHPKAPPAHFIPRSRPGGVEDPLLVPNPATGFEFLDTTNAHAQFREICCASIRPGRQEACARSDTMSDDGFSYKWTSDAKGERTIVHVGYAVAE